ncbi:hypothetical protein B0H66DRAFT_12902 [Apodospora peruviana]|uniref:DUF7721 domain-containing protein n=1 Tax=Apodospora peruviana TaxID=516989 RepID=A0AAE0IQ28_9PEZI|nr:hypothetical protein B0H66DRAFT_12902 [Apodospora peruviana]
MTHGGAYPAGGGFYSHEDDEDFCGAAQHAQAGYADANEDSADFFSGILNQLGSRKQQVAQEDIDEDDAVRHHQEFFGNSSSSDAATSSGMGTAAAMQALKMFTSGASTSTAASQPQSQSQSAFIGLAMSQAAKLFDRQASQGNVSSGANKESAVMKAGEMALKIYLKSQGTRAAAGGGAGAAGGSRLPGLLSMAGKFMQ